MGSGSFFLILTRFPSIDSLRLIAWFAASRDVNPKIACAVLWFSLHRLVGQIYFEYVSDALGRPFSNSMCERAARFSVSKDVGMNSAMV